MNLPASLSKLRTVITECKRRNAVLFWYGWLNMTAAFICLFLMFVDDRQVAGINAWIKPLKFYISIAIFCWTIAWYLDYLQFRRSVKIYTVVVVLTMFIEMALITFQAAGGVKSHFNVTTARDAMIFFTMGVSILIFTLWTFYIFILFVKQRRFTLSPGYTWGIRMGLLFFVIFAMEGGMMAAFMRHTVGAEDGGEGLPILNWSTQYGDLRIAHFFGMHALQVLPASGYYIFKTKRSLLIFSFLYFLIVTFMLLRALMGLPIY